jgi:hypothetical protein
MYYIGLDVHKKTISYCVKDAAGQIHQEGKIGSRLREVDSWIKTLPHPRMIAMEATIFTGWIYDHQRLGSSRPQRHAKWPCHPRIANFAIPSFLQWRTFGQAWSTPGVR